MKWTPRAALRQVGRLTSVAGVLSLVFSSTSVPVSAASTTIHTAAVASPVASLVAPGTGAEAVQPKPTSQAVTTVVRIADLEPSTDKVQAFNNEKWFFYQDENDTIVKTLGSFAFGPATPAQGVGSIQISTSGTSRPNLATYQFKGIPLSDITTLSFDTYNPSAGNPGSANRSGYLQFNVDFVGNDTWQRRLIFLPSDNGTVIQNQWKTWDGINGGNALWRYSGTNWPAPNAADLGSTPKTWNEILSDYPSVRTRATDSFFGIRVGEPYNDGYTEFIDNVRFASGSGPLAKNLVFDFEPNNPIIIQAGDLEPSSRPTAEANGKWFFYNDENDTINNAIGGFTVGPATPPFGVGSAQATVTGTQRVNLATYQFSNKTLADITTLRFSTYNPTAGNGGGANRSGYLNFNVDFAGNDSWQRRLIFLPSDNGTIVPDSWQEWDTIKNGTALWRYSGTTWPAPGTMVSGSTPKSWSQILTEYPGVKTRTTDAFMGIRVGEPYNNGYTENLDAFKFATGDSQVTYNFEGAPTCTTTCYVNAATGSDGFSGSTPSDPKKTIQNAVTTVNASGNVIVASGIYTEQVSINKSLTLTGAGVGQTIVRSPSSLVTQFTFSGNPYKGVIGAVGANNVTIQGLTIDGDGQGNANNRIVGVGMLNSGGVISGTEIIKVRNNPLNGVQHGVGIYVANDDATARNVNMMNNAISDFQKNGIVMSGAGLTGIISGNTVTGAGAQTLIAQNGIQVSFGAGATVTRNIVKDILCNHAVCGPDLFTQTQSGGFLIYDSANVTLSQNSAINVDIGYLVLPQAANNVIVDQNYAKNNRYAAITAFNASSGDGGPVAITGNSIDGPGNYGIAGITYAGETANLELSINTNSIVGVGTAIALLEQAGATVHPVLLSDATANDINRATINAIEVTNGALGNVFTGNYITPTVGAGSGVIGTTNNAPLAGPVVTNRYVATNGTDVGVCTDPALPCKTIAYVISASSDGDIDNVGAGTFTDFNVIDRAVTLRGAKTGIDARTRATSGETVLNNSTGTFSVQFNGVVVDGFTVQDQVSGTFGSGIHLPSNYSGNQVLNNIFKNNVMGVYLSSEGSIPTVLSQNLFQGNNNSGPGGGNGIYGDATIKNVVIDNNRFTGNDNSAMVITTVGTPQTGVTITNNEVITNASMVLIGIDGGTVAGNSLNTISGSGIYVEASNNLVIANNVVTGATSAVRLHNQYGIGTNGVITVSNNVLAGSDYGINVASNALSAPITVVSNSITSNVNGVNNTSSQPLNASCNWWGSITGPTNAGNSGGTGSTLVGPAAFAPWLNSGTDSSAAIGFQPAAGTCNITNVAQRIVFSTQPGNGTPTSPLAPQPVVRVEDNAGNLVINYSGAVQVSFASNPSGASLIGTTAMNVVSGTAMFTNLQVNQLGDNYTFFAQTGGLTAISAEFDVVANPPTATATSVPSATSTAVSSATPTSTPVGPTATPTATPTQGTGGAGTGNILALPVIFKSTSAGLSGW